MSDDRPASPPSSKSTYQKPHLKELGPIGSETQGSMNLGVDDTPFDLVFDPPSM